MPASYDYRTSSYRISCRSCGTEVRSSYPWSDEATTADGALVSDTFRFLRSRGDWQYLCRSCEREYNRNRRARSPRRSRVPGTTRDALGLNRKFGVEFECISPDGDRDRIRAALAAEGLHGWTVKGDGSLTGGYGVEIVSPPLRGEQGEDDIRKAARALRSVGCTVNRSCGTHVHHDIADLTVEDIKRVARGWFNNQAVINGLVSPSRRDGGSIYCEPLRDSEVRSVEAASNLSAIRSLYISRYRTLNLTSYGRHGTIEIRQHQGTLDAEKVISWLRLGQAIIDSAKVTEQAAPVASTVRQFLGSLGEQLDETARTFLLGRAVEFNYATV
jgi:hypothetical protein